MPHQDKPCVYIILLNWNNYADTKQCLESLAAATYPNFKTLVVDNGSADGSGQQLQKQFPNLKFIFNDHNLGFSRGCNVGIRAALNDPASAYVLLLNNDSTVAPGFLEEAVLTAEGNRSIGLVGGKILQSADNPVISYAGGAITRWRGGMIIRGFGEVDRGQYDQVCETEFITGALMLIRREVLEKVGLLPEEYFFGVEEQDYSFAVRRAGYTLYYVPSLLAYHRGDGSHWNWDPKFVYNGYRNRLIFQEKYMPAGLFLLWKMLFSLYARYGAKLAWRRLAKKYGYDREQAVAYDDMHWAFIKAVEDHNKNDLCEETLARFAAGLEEKKAKQRKSGALKVKKAGRQ
jgi:GT2 family glycosyltransferase